MTQCKGMQDHPLSSPRKQGLGIAQSFWMKLPSDCPASAQRAMRICPAFAEITTAVQLPPIVSVPLVIPVSHVIPAPAVILVPYAISATVVISPNAVIPAKAGIQYPGGTT